MNAGPAPFLNAIAPYRDDLVVCVECLFTWYGRADLCTQEGISFVLGHALSMKAIHGGQATHDTSDAHQSAVLRRGGLLPQASVYPAELRATRALRRRRLARMRQRAERLPHVQPTTHPDHRPAIGPKLADQATRDGRAERLPDPAVQQRSAVDRASLDDSARLLTPLARTRVQTAKAQAAQTCSRWRSLPGLGQCLARGLRDELHDSHRCPRVQECGAYGRRVTCAKESAGKRSGTAGQKLGKASRTWAVAAAAGLCLRNHPASPQSLARVEQTPGQGQARTGLAHHLARAVSDMWQRDPGFELAQVFQAGGRGAGAPAASRAATGSSLASACWSPCDAASWHASPAAQRRFSPDPGAWLGRWRGRRSHGRGPSVRDVGGPVPDPGTHWRPSTVQPPL